MQHPWKACAAMRQRLLSSHQPRHAPRTQLAVSDSADRSNSTLLKTAPFNRPLQIRHSVQQAFALQIHATRM